jgi:hypothetical protein
MSRSARVGSYDPYFQYFTGVEFFHHAFPHERSDLSIGAAGSAPSWGCCWPRACASLMPPACCAPRTWRGSRSTPPCSPRRQLSNRRQAVACRPQGAQPTGQKARRAPAATVSALRLTPVCSSVLSMARLALRSRPWARTISSSQAGVPVFCTAMRMRSAARACDVTSANETQTAIRRVIVRRVRNHIT